MMNVIGRPPVISLFYVESFQIQLPTWVHGALLRYSFFVHYHHRRTYFPLTYSQRDVLYFDFVVVGILVLVKFHPNLNTIDDESLLLTNIHSNRAF